MTPAPEMKLRMRVRLPKDRTNRPRGKVLLRPLPPPLLCPGPPTQSPLRFEAAILSRTRSPSSQRARAKVDEGPFARLNATRRKLTPGTWLAISALHLIENRLDGAAGLQWTSSSRLPRSILAIAAGAD